MSCGHTGALSITRGGDRIAEEGGGVVVEISSSRDTRLQHAAAARHPAPALAPQPLQNTLETRTFLEIARRVGEVSAIKHQLGVGVG